MQNEHISVIVQNSMQPVTQTSLQEDICVISHNADEPPSFHKSPLQNNKQTTCDKTSEKQYESRSGHNLNNKNNLFANPEYNFHVRTKNNSEYLLRFDNIDVYTAHLLSS